MLEPIEASDDEAEDSSTDDGEDFETTPIDARSAGVIGSSMHEGGATEAAANQVVSWRSELAPIDLKVPINMHEILLEDSRWRKARRLEVWGEMLET